MAAAADANLPSPGDDRATIFCLYCGKPQEVGRKAQTITCKFCYKPLQLKDLNIKAYEARRAVETVGIVTVEKRGNVVADRINCGGLIVRGKAKGTVHSRGPVLVGPEAELKGDVTAPALTVGAGAVLEGQYTIGKVEPKEQPKEAPPIAQPVAAPAQPPIPEKAAG
jgi:cytoskeletal protein CcmA (bactofilin family)